ncbi:hypothetical protein K435DRAFT_873992 [Dendrothele bispora CBS 962.96]|uniref:Uncharacterized protein n=1 Tax=Dendrothele bispora (strain CBS 962.96) TaxID=1314807 RepID=A0A4V6T4Z9_DENBC|nr:hypothetical protein K435DRAFT_873992 [Dendrothele bispora CBS 962.96]
MAHQRDQDTTTRAQPRHDDHNQEMTRSGPRHDQGATKTPPVLNQGMTKTQPGRDQDTTRCLGRNLVISWLQPGGVLVVSPGRVWFVTW